MNHRLSALAVAALLSLTLSACGSSPVKTAEAPKEPAKPAQPTISAEARQALTQAEADVKMAKTKFALWTVAEDALKAAQEAAKSGDSAVVLKKSAQTSELVKGGMAQLSYPSTEQK